MDTPMKDAFEQFWQWASKPAGSYLTIPDYMRRAVAAMAPHERLDRAMLNAAVAKERAARNGKPPAKRLTRPADPAPDKQKSVFRAARLSPDPSPLAEQPQEHVRTRLVRSRGR